MSHKTVLGNSMSLIRFSGYSRQLTHDSYNHEGAGTAVWLCITHAANGRQVVLSLG